jgi:hypothetical protein
VETPAELCGVGGTTLPEGSHKAADQRPIVDLQNTLAFLDPESEGRRGGEVSAEQSFELDRRLRLIFDLVTDA